MTKKVTQIEVEGKTLEEAIKKAETEKKSLRDKQADEINDLRKEIEHLKEKLKLVLEIVRRRPEYSIPLPAKPETYLPEGIFRIPVRPSIIMPVPEKPSNKD